MKRIRLVLGAMIAAAFTLSVPAATHAATGTVTIGSQSHVLNGTNIYRSTNYLVQYTPAYGARTRTNQYGFEAAVVGGTITTVQDGVGNMAIPSNGYVLSGHGDSRTWLRANAKVGATVTIGGTQPPPPSNAPVANLALNPATGTAPLTLTADGSGSTDDVGVTSYTFSWGDGATSPPQTGATAQHAYPNPGTYTVTLTVKDADGNSASASKTLTVTSQPPTTTGKLPDIGVRTLRNFSIVNTGGKKLLKFPVVTSNVGAGPLEIRATRSSSTSTDWVGRQVVYNSDGSTSTLPSTGAQFYYATDGHNHWHIRDFDLYQLFNSGGSSLRVGEKHGYCFEDNTTYRDWVGSPKHPEAPTSPVYTHSGSCGEGHPEATSIVHGLSVGWGDTYPTSLPDQAIDVTGVPDGTYLVKVTADWQGFWRETNESNNSASAQIRISGNSVTLLSATDGL
jgi:PKD repeat protein